MCTATLPPAAAARAASTAATTSARSSATSGLVSRESGACPLPGAMLPPFARLHAAREQSVGAAAPGSHTGKNSGCSLNSLLCTS
jgi:hypothetical protein